MIKKNLLIFSSMILVTSMFFQCQKNTCEGCRVRPPLADAGRDTLIVLPLDSALLDGRASTDPDGSISEWSWKKISGPPSCVISTPHASRTVVKDLVMGTYQFELTVTDDAGLSAKDTVQVIANADASNRAPVANAGIDQGVLLPIDTAILDGSASADPDNNILAYRWVQMSGPSSSTIANAIGAKTQVSGLLEGVYQFELKVTDAGGLFSSATVRVTVTSLVNGCDIDSRPVVDAHLIPVGSLSLGRVDLLTATANNKIVFAGGYAAAGVSALPSPRVDIYDVINNSWSIADLTKPNRYEMGISSVGNKILFAGGGTWNGDSCTSRVDIYDALANTWSTAELSEPRTGIAAATLGNRVYFAGGYRDDTKACSKRVDIYDNSTNTWSVDSLSVARYSPSGITVDDRIYFAGGAVGSTILATIDIFDGTTNTWSTSMLQEPKIYMASIAVGNNIFWGGGGRELVEIRDATTGASSFTCMPARSSPKAVLKDDNIVFFTGYGSTPFAGTHFDIYNLTTKTWSVGLLPQPILGAAVISLNNTIYVAGGSRDFTFPPYYTQVWKLEF